MLTGLDWVSRNVWFFLYMYIAFYILWAKRAEISGAVCLVCLNISCFISSLCLHKKAKVAPPVHFPLSLSLQMDFGEQNIKWMKTNIKLILKIYVSILTLLISTINSLYKYVLQKLERYLWACTVHLTTRTELCISNWIQAFPSFGQGQRRLNLQTFENSRCAFVA